MPWEPKPYILLSALYLCYGISSQLFSCENFQPKCILPSVSDPSVLTFMTAVVVMVDGGDCGGSSSSNMAVDYVWNVMTHTHKPDFVFLQNGRVHLNWGGRHILAAEVCASAVVCSEVVWRVLATHSIRQFTLHFPSRASPFAITFQLDSTTWRFHHATNGYNPVHYDDDD
jgi:hypothetical protein